MTTHARLHPLRFLAPIVAIALLAGLLSAAPAAANVDASVARWVSGASAPSTVLDSVERNAAKLPPEFAERLEHALPDGTLRVMVSLGGRNATIDRFIEASTTTLGWYSATPSFYATVTPDQLAALLDAAFVRFVEPDYPIHYSLAVSAPDVNARGTAEAPGVWSFDKTGGSRGALRSDVPGLTVDQATGKGVTVAVIDSGIDKTHADFGGWDCDHGIYQPCENRVRTFSTNHLGAGFTAGDPHPTGNDFASGHGTHVAGIVAGNGYYVRDYAIADPSLAEPDIYGGDGFPIGVAPQASLINVKNGDSQSAAFGTLALDWLADNAQELGVRVANNSWGCLGGCSFNGTSATAQTLKALYQAGVVVTFAAGNDGGGANGNAFSGNAQSPYVLGVASYDATTHQLASSSSRGSSAAPLPTAATWTPESEPVNGHRRPDVAAPGENIWSARNLTGGTTTLVPRQNSADVTGGFGCCIREYAAVSGTSMAAPHVSGAAALLVGACPGATTLDVMRSIMVGADAARVFKTGSTSVRAEPFEVGYGGLDVRAGLDWLLGQTACGGSGTTNSAPVASDDSLSLNQGASDAVDVLANDVDADGDDLSVVSATTPASGDVSIAGDGSITYTPRSDFFGVDTFDYVIADGKGASDTGTVTVDVNGAPLASDDSATTKKQRALRVDVVANDSDPEADAFTLTDSTQAAQGSVDCSSSGTCTYVPNGRYKGTDSFAYVVCDAHGACSEAAVAITVR